MIDGRVSIYTEGSGDDDAKSCLTSIENGMSGDSLLAAHSAIKGFAFIGTSLPDNIADDGSLNDDNISDRGDNTPQTEGIAWSPVYTAGITAASVLLVVSAIFVRYKNRKPAQNDDDNGDDSDSPGSGDWQDESSELPLSDV